MDITPPVIQPATSEEPGLDSNHIGMLAFIASEAIFFSLLILAYVYYGAKGYSGPNGKSSLEPLTTGIFSLCLFASSGTLWLAEHRYKKRDYKGLVVWLMVTVVLGLLFLGGQGLEYYKLLSNSINPNTNLFGTTFFTLTGFHGLHVLIGLIILSVTAGLAWAGDFRDNKPASTISTVALYWHFVDAVWVVIFSVVYLFSA